MVWSCYVCPKIWEGLKKKKKKGDGEGQVEATFDSTKPRGEGEAHVARSMRKVIIDMSSRRAVRNTW